MTDEDLAIEGRLKSYIELVTNKPLGLELGELAGKHLINDLEMDSLDIINMLFQIEEKEQVDISEADMEAESLFGFARLAEHIRQKRVS